MTNSAQDMVDYAFNAYLDFVVEDVAAAGVADADAVELVFSVAASLSEQGTMPEFPDDKQTWVEKARWLVAAKEIDFRGFVREVLSG